MPFLDVPSESSEASTKPLPPLNLGSKVASGGNAARPGAKLTEIVITPQPGFVVKTLLATSLPHPPTPAKTKLFINVTHAEEVPVPTEEEAQRGMLHCVVAEMRRTVDKSGKESLITDATLPTMQIHKAKRDKHYKQWLIQVVLEKVEERHGVELSRDYSEPNIKVKGDLPPRRAVLPVYEATGSGNPKIVEVNEAGGSSKLVPSNLRTTQTVSGQQVSDIAKDRRGKEKLKPKHAFDLVDSSTEGAKQGFIMTIQLPEEPATAMNLRDVKLELSPAHLRLSTSLYTLATELPRDIVVDSVLEEGGGAEWSIADKALRIRGLLAA